MAKGYEIYLDKLVTDSIEIKGLLIDMLCGMKELSGKLDTLISLEQAESQHRQQRQEPQSEK